MAIPAEGNRTLHFYTSERGGSGKRSRGNAHFHRGKMSRVIRAAERSVIFRSRRSRKGSFETMGVQTAFFGDFLSPVKESCPSETISIPPARQQARGNGGISPSVFLPSAKRHLPRQREVGRRGSAQAGPTPPSALRLSQPRPSGKGRGRPRLVMWGHLPRQREVGVRHDRNLTCLRGRGPR